MTGAAGVLLDALVDYAGLFPPAELPMRAALGAYASGRRGPDEWMLGRFVLPLGRLEEFERAFDELPDAERAKRWPLAVIVGGDLESDAREIADFNRRHGEPARRDAGIDAVDVKVRGLEDVTRAVEFLAEPVERYFELAAGTDPSSALDAVAGVGGRAKVRTGGVTADLFPSIRDLARFLEACADRKVAFKATAGLHHPIRSVHPMTAAERSPSATMHGFLNLFLAAVLAWSRGARTDALEPVLAEESPGAFVFDATGVRVHGALVTSAEIASARRSFALSFGSCSLDEPVADLKALGLI